MGTPIPPPDELEPVAPGELCDRCWGPGEIFGDGPTPSEITVVIDGVEKGPNWQVGDEDPPNDTYVLPQFLGIGPCVFSKLTEPNVEVIFDVGSTIIIASVPVGGIFFQGTTAEKCKQIIADEWVDHYTGGTATIFFPPVE